MLTNAQAYTNGQSNVYTVQLEILAVWLSEKGGKHTVKMFTQQKLYSVHPHPNF